jgi:hypothetical protein
MATSKGWLFHLGSSHERDSDPYFSGLITERPPDASVPVIYPDLPPSEAGEQTAPAEPAPPAPTISQPARRGKAKPLLLHVKSRFLHGRTLVVSFTLTARAHVQLVGRRKRQVVARTRRESLRPGRHELTLTLNPAHWPTKLQFLADPLGGSATSAQGSENPNSSNTVST